MFLRPDDEIAEEIHRALQAFATPAPMLGQAELRVLVNDGMVVLRARRSAAATPSRLSAPPR